MTHRHAAAIEAEQIGTQGDPWVRPMPVPCSDCEDRRTCLLERPREGEACRHYWRQGGSDGTASP